MNRDKKYMKSMNTYAYLPLSKKKPLYPKTSLKKASKNINSKNNFTYSEINNISRNNANLLNKVYSKNKFRGVLDTTSPNNKDIFIDSDSERPSKNREKKSKISNKNRCTKLVIEKVESQKPVNNNEYYKFTNQKPKGFVVNSNNFSKKSFSNKNLLLRYSSKTQINKNVQRNNSSNYNYIAQHRQPATQFQIFNNDTLKRNNKHGSTNNIFTSDSYFYNSNNNFTEPEYLFRTQAGFNKVRKIKDISYISRSPYYLKTSNDTLLKDSSIGNNYIIYTNDSIGLNTYNQEFSIPNNVDNTGYQYLYNHTDNNQRYKINGTKRANLYDSYKDLLKVNKFIKLSKNNNSHNSKIINAYPRYKEKIVKIQSLWRGAYVRELMTFYLDLNRFKNILDKIMKYHLYDYFTGFKDRLNNNNKKYIKKKSTDKIIVNQRYKYSKNKVNGKNKEKENKIPEEYKQILEKKDENYENLLKNYNSLVTELQNIISNNEDNNNIIDKNNLKEILNNHKIRNKMKKFDIIKPEQKDKFHLTHEGIDDKSVKIKTMDDNNQSISNHFTSNIQIINNEHFLIEKAKNINKILYDIISFELSLISNKENKPKLIDIYHCEEFNIINNIKEKEPKVCSDESNSIINNKIKPKMFDVITINKDKNNEVTILNSSEKIKEKNKDNDKDKNKPQNYHERNIIICENERFNLIKIFTNTNDVNKDKNNTVELNTENNKKESNNMKNDFIIVNNDNLFFEKIKIFQIDKITEITNELNKLEPNNHYELIFKGLIKGLNNTNKTNIIDNNKQEFSYIQKKEKVNISCDNKNENGNINYNLTNEIAKEYSLEINPFELKRAIKKGNNIMITHENIFEVLYKDNSIFTEKAKRNIMKIILPIKLKITLREFIHRSIFSLLINIPKKSPNEDLDKTGKPSIKELIEEEREKARSIKSSFYNKYHLGQMKKKEIQKILANYAIYKWNKLLYKIAKEIINNKNVIMKK